MTGFDMGKCFPNRRHPVTAPWIRMAALTVALVVLWGNLGMVTSMGAQAGASIQVDAQAGTKDNTKNNTQANQRLFDEAGLLSGAEQERLEDALADCRKKTGMDVSAVTAYNDGARSAMEYADDYYDYNDFGTGKDKSGVLVLIYMDAPGRRGGECWISTSGNMIRILTDKRVDLILDDMYDYLGIQDYYGAVLAFTRDIEYYVDKGIQAGQYNYDTETGEISIYRSIRWYEAAFAVIAPAMIAGSVCLGIKGRYSMKQSDRERANSLLAYRADAKYRFGDVNDILLNKFVTSAPIPRGGSGSGGSGSSGRSSTHRSSSGRSHGGGGRRF